MKKWRECLNQVSAISFRYSNENCSNTAVHFLLKAMRSFWTTLMIRFSGLGANLPLVAQGSVRIGEETLVPSKFIAELRRPKGPPSGAP